MNRLPLVKKTSLVLIASLLIQTGSFFTPGLIQATHTDPVPTSVPVPAKSDFKLPQLPSVTSLPRVAKSVQNAGSGTFGVIGKSASFIARVIITIIEGSANLVIGTTKWIGNSLSFKSNAKPSIAVVPVEIAATPAPVAEGASAQVLGITEDVAALAEKVAALQANVGTTSVPSLSNINTTSDNLLRNSSFEVETSSKPRQWNYQLNSGTTTTFRSDEGIHSGKYGLKFKGGTSLMGISQPETKTVPGRSYTFSTYIKAVDTSSFTLRVGFWDEKDNTYAIMKDFSFSGTKEWSRVSMQVTTDGLITDSKNWFPMIEVTGLTSGAVYLDDAQMEEGSVLTTYDSAVAVSGVGSVLGDGSIVVGTNGDLHPAQTGVGNIGTSGNKWEDLYISDDANIGDNLTTDGDIIVNGDDISSDGNLAISATGYVRIGDGTNTPGVAASDDELYVQGDIESDGNIDVAGTLTVGGAQTFTGAATFDSIDITPSTNIDSLDITGTNITTASLIDLDATATTTGNIIDIDTSTTHSGHVLSVDNTGNNVWTGNIIDVDTGTGDAAGDVINIAIEAGATDVQGIVVTNAAATDQAGWLASVDASAAWTANAINFLQSAGVSTADVIAYDNSGNTATTGDFISFASGTGDADGDVFDITVEAGATSTQIFDINNAAVSDEAGWLMEVDTTGAWTGNAIDFTTGAQAWTGNILDINFGNAAATGDVINIDIPALAVAVQNIVVANAAASSTAGWLMDVNATGIFSAAAIDLDSTAAQTGAMIHMDNSGNAAWTGHLIDVETGTGDYTGNVLDVFLEASTANDGQVLVVVNDDESDIAGWLAAVDAQAAFTSDMIDFDSTTNDAWTGNLIDVDTGTGNYTGNVLDVFLEASTNNDGQVIVVVNDDESDIAGWLANVDAQAAFTSNMIQFDSTTNDIWTGNLIDVDTGTGDVSGNIIDLNFEAGATDVQGIVVNNAAATDQAGWLMDINTTGAWSANMIDITTATAASSGNMIDINFGAVADTGDAINIAVGSTAVAAQALVVTDSTIKTADLISITSDGATVASGIDLMSLAYTTGNGTDIRNSVVNIALISGGTAATDLAQGILLDLTSTAGGLDTAIEIENTAAWDIDIALQNDEQIVNSTDDMVDFIGAAGTDNTDLRIDLDGTRPVISSPTDAIIEIAEDVEITGSNLFLALDNEASRDFALCVAADDGGATPGTTLQEVDDCDAAVTADYAERYPTDGSAEFGDVMVLGTKAVILTTGESIPQLVKSTSVYQRSLVGVVSNNTADFTSAGYNVPDDQNPQSIALVGRVPVKVTNENGPIAEGDYLTTSSTAGYAMKATKAGPVVGMALGSFSGDKGTVMTFIKAAWFDPIAEAKQAILAALGMSSRTVGQTLGASTIPTTIDATDTTGEIQSATNVLSATTDGSLGVLAEEADLLVHGLLTANTLRVTNAAQFDGTLTVKGLATFEGDLTVAGTARVAGNLEIGGAVVITATADSSISSGSVVAVSGNNRVRVAHANDSAVLGLATNSADKDGVVQVAVAGKVGGLSNLAAGASYYVSNGGGVSATQTDEAAHVGVALSNSELIVQISGRGGKPAAQPTPSTQPAPTAAPSASEPVVSSTPAPTPVVTVEPSATPVPTVQPTTAPEVLGQSSTTIVIGQSELGFVRVRADATTTSDEVGQVNVGQTFSVSETSNGFYKIEYAPGQFGWVSDNYAALAQ